MAKDYWNERAKREGELAVGHHRWNQEKFLEQTQKEQRLILPFLPAPFSINKLIDFGCGIGRMAAWLSSLFSEAYIGVDFSREMIELAKKTCPKLNFVLIEEVLPFDNGSIDFVFSCTVLQHIVKEDHLIVAVSEISRVLKTKSHIVLFENTTQMLPSASHVKFRSPQEYYEIFIEVGIKLQQEISATFEGELHTVFTGIKL